MKNDTLRQQQELQLHGDDSSFRTRACQFVGRIPAHEAETVREQQHTHHHSTRSGPQRGLYVLPAINIAVNARYPLQGLALAWPSARE
jgi:hypothetical protein